MVPLAKDKEMAAIMNELIKRRMVVRISLKGAVVFELDAKP